MSTDLCPCGTQVEYQNCCGRFHHQSMNAKTVEALMRSRYSAYVLSNAPYIMNTWALEQRPTLTKAELSETRWLRLEVIKAQQGLKRGSVEFNAYYEQQGQERVLHEHSLFKKIKGRWYYVSAL